MANPPYTFTGSSSTGTPVAPYGAPSGGWYTQGCVSITYDYGGKTQDAGVSTAGGAISTINYLLSIGATNVTETPVDCATGKQILGTVPISYTPPSTGSGSPSGGAPSPTPPPSASLPPIDDDPFADPPLPTSPNSVDIGVEILVGLENVYNLVKSLAPTSSGGTGGESECCSKVLIALGAIATAIVANAPPTPNPDPVTCAQLQEAAATLATAIETALNPPTPVLDLPDIPVYTPPTAQQAYADLATWEEAWVASLPALPGLPSGSQ